MLEKNIIIVMPIIKMIPNSVPLTCIDLPRISLKSIQSKTIRKWKLRKGGLRLGNEKIQEKYVFHNYGHGMSKTSLAFGSVIMTCKSVQSRVSHGQYLQLSVLGAGIIGLMTAIQLSKKGYHVTVYVDKVPTFQNSDNNQSSAESSFDDGLYFPLDFDESDKFQYQILCKLTFDFYEQCLKTNRYQSFSDARILFPKSQTEQIKWPLFLLNYAKEQKIQFNKTIIEDYLSLRSIKIDLRFFLKELKTQASLRGVKFIKTNFQNLNSILQLPSSMIFNCLGSNSAKFFSDKNFSSFPQPIIRHPLILNPKSLLKNQGINFSQKSFESFESQKSNKKNLTKNYNKNNEIQSSKSSYETNENSIFEKFNENQGKNLQQSMKNVHFVIVFSELLTMKIDFQNGMMKLVKLPLTKKQKQQKISIQEIINQFRLYFWNRKIKPKL